MKRCDFHSTLSDLRFRVFRGWTSPRDYHAGTLWAASNVLLVLAVVAGGLFLADPVAAQTPPRWSCEPHPVYLGHPRPTYLKAARDALRQVEEATGLRFPVTSDPKVAHVIVDWRKPPFPVVDGQGEWGRTVLDDRYLTDGTTRRVGATVYLNPRTSDRMIGLVLHEFGHVVGLSHVAGFAVMGDGWGLMDYYGTRDLTMLGSVACNGSTGEGKVSS